MAMAPVIGVAACRALTDYLESIRRNGGEPRVLMPGDIPPAEATAGLDGLLLTGGDDVDPARYGAVRHPAVTHVDPARDAFEIDLANRALAADLPLLAICRGVQLLNVARGGTLTQDIPSEVPGALNHQVSTPPYAIAHEVWLNKDTLLWSLMHERLEENDVCGVNSRHHQAVARLAAGFVVSATAPDGIIEGIEAPSARFCLGVQWHPENFWRTGEFRPVFEGFVDACRVPTGTP
ncbi:MAG TPA: gamma-glutamyl-gamma-aminobutyrate hydrolase family protein [Vicinamibacterales bacterium]|nr:gamma-glutamyl-gamma-aminobutyrate hydrolase family protein [Vicinamibacterales bacterium]